MSLTPLRSIALAAMAVAVATASCGGSPQAVPTAPSVLPAAGMSQPAPEQAAMASALEPGAAGGTDTIHRGDPPATPPPPHTPGAPPNATPPAGSGPDTNPGPWPAPTTNTPIQWTPSNHPRVQLRVDPNPVPFSGVPVPLASCQGLAHTWYYDQVIAGLSGITVRIRERENFFDGRFVSRIAQTIEIQGNDTSRVSSRWCSAFGTAHTAQHRYKAEDAEGNDIIVNGPLVRLNANPNYTPRQLLLKPGDELIVVFGD